MTATLPSGPGEAGAMFYHVPEVKVLAVAIYTQAARGVNAFIYLC